MRLFGFFYQSHTQTQRQRSGRQSGETRAQSFVFDSCDEFSVGVDRQRVILLSVTAETSATLLAWRITQPQFNLTERINCVLRVNASCFPTSTTEFGLKPARTHHDAVLRDSQRIFVGQHQIPRRRKWQRDQFC